MNQSTGRLREIWQDLKPRLSAFGNQTFLSELKELFRIRKNPEGRTKLIVFAAGAIATAVSMGGILIGYAVGYNKFMRPDGEVPRLSKLPLIVKAAMAIGGVLIWIVLILIIVLLRTVLGAELLHDRFMLTFLLVNTVLSFSSYFIFRRWRNSIHNLLASADQYGSTRYARLDELSEFFMSDGLYIGGNMAVDRKGHFITFAPSRSGKGVSLIIPNILGLRNYQGSMVLVDIKGEAAAVCARQLRKQGKKVVIINPYELLSDRLGDSDCYNPLSMLKDKTSINLVEDVAMIAELIVPIKTEDHNAFFTDSARNVITGLLLHLVTSVEQPTLTMLWEWVRFFGDQWDNLLADMSDSNDPVNGHAIRNAANEIAKLSESPETFASIISNALEATAFLRSGSLQKSMTDGFDPYSLAADGNIIVFVIVPADQLPILGRYLRLVTTTMLRSVVKKPSKKVTFILDEAASLGYLSEVPVAMAAYAGFNLSMWLIYQDITQLQDTYGKRWESIMANCHVKHFASVNDNTTAEYVSKMMGKKTRTVYSRDLLGFVKDVETSERDLATPDEVSRQTKDHMLIMTSGNYPVSIQKYPYFYMQEFKDAQGNNLYDPNPYEANSL